MHRNTVENDDSPSCGLAQRRRRIRPLFAPRTQINRTVDLSEGALSSYFQLVTMAEPNGIEPSTS